GLSTHWPDESLRRVLQAMRSPQTEVPLGVVRSSGSRVRFPVRTTRLMFVAAIGGSFASTRVKSRLETEPDVVKEFAPAKRPRKRAIRRASLPRVPAGARQRRRGPRRF